MTVLPRAALALGLAALLAASCSATAADQGVPVRVRLSCNEIHEMLQNMPFDRLHERSGPVSDVSTSLQEPGCMIVGEGSRARLSVLERTSATRPDARLRELMPNRGWQEDMRYAGSGPGHTAFAYVLGGVRCYVSAHWDGADPDPEADPPSAAPTDRYDITISCAEAGGNLP